MLATEICGVKLRNPTVLASGILGVTASSLKRIAEEGGAGAVTTKSISLEKRKGHKGPVIVEIGGGMLNAVGLSSPPAEEVIDEVKELVHHLKIPLVVSFFAKTPEDFALLAEKLSEIKPALLEANISCPNLEGKIIGCDIKLAQEVVEKVKEATSIPLVVKLTPKVPDIKEIAKGVEEAGADAISAINTVGPGMVIDVKAAAPILGNKFGGISGSLIKPIAVRCVYDIYEEVKIPIIGMGGINSGEDAIEMLMAGASAVGVGTAIMHHDITIFKKISQEIEEFMREENYSSLKELIGKAHK